MVYEVEGLKGFNILTAKNENCDEVINMLKQIALWMKNNEINQWGFLLEGGDDEEIEQAISNGQTYILLKDTKLVATFTLTPKQSEWDQHIWGVDNTTKALYLHRLAIIPTHMKKGIGRSILAWIQNNVSDREYIRLNCVADNKKLNDFYKKNEFELIGFTDGHSKYQKAIRNEFMLK